MDTQLNPGHVITENRVAHEREIARRLADAGWQAEWEDLAGGHSGIRVWWGGEQAGCSLLFTDGTCDYPPCETTWGVALDQNDETVDGWDLRVPACIDAPRTALALDTFLTHVNECPGCLFQHTPKPCAYSLALPLRALIHNRNIAEDACNV